jgi:hypothetical protein
VTSFATRWPPSVTALALDLVGAIPPLHPSTRGILLESDDISDAARRLTEEEFLRSITLSKGDDPELDVPTVLLFPRASWSAIQAMLGVTSPGEQPHDSVLWHDAIPTADDDVLLIPGSPDFRSASYYRATSGMSPDIRYALRAGFVLRRADDEVVWEDQDDRCHLIRYASGRLACHDLNCGRSCGGPAEVDDSGIEHLPCGCPE